MRPFGRLTASAVAVVAGMALTVALVARSEQPAATARPGVPLLSEVHLAGQHFPVLITPNRPGTNLVLVGGEADGVRVGRAPDTAGLPAVDRPGALGKWATVDLPPGPGTVWLELAGERASLAVDPLSSTVDATGPDGPECAAAALGAAIADPPRPLLACPADSLTPDDAASLRALVDFLASRGISTLTLATDNSPRSAAAGAAVREAAARRRLTVTTEPGRDNALIVVSGWATASTTRRLDTVVFSAGTYLAPWLLTAPILATTPGAVLPLRFNPRDDQPVRYQTILSTRFHGQPPTATGYQTWLPTPPTEPTRLYAASRVAIMPTELTHGHHQAAWLPGGTIVPVSGPLAPQ